MFAFTVIIPPACVGTNFTLNNIYTATVNCYQPKQLYFHFTFTAVIVLLLENTTHQSIFITDLLDAPNISKIYHELTCP